MPALHLSVLLFGVAGLFGKLLSLSPVVIVFGRVLFASLALAALLGVRGIRLSPSPTAPGRREAGTWLLGALLAAHWITFFHAIQLSSVAVGLLTFSTFPVFTAFLEPWIGRERVRWSDVGLALLALAGVACVVPRPDVADAVTRGALWGVVSGATFALLSIANRRYVQSVSPLVLAFRQDVVAAVLLAPALLVFEAPSSLRDWGLLALLGVVFTALAHALFIEGLRRATARTASIVATLEPVYGIALAAWLLGERPEPRVLVGGAVILAVAALVTLRTARAPRGTSAPP
jgi:drug/metabolite transporter (DMT)-like permease